MTKDEQTCEFLKLLIEGTKSSVLKWERDSAGKQQLCLGQDRSVFAWKTSGKICLSYDNNKYLKLYAPAGFSVGLSRIEDLLRNLWNLIDSFYGAHDVTAHYIDLLRTKLHLEAKYGNDD